MLFLSLLYYIVYSKLTNKLTGPSLELYGIQPTMVGIYNNVKLDVDTTFVFCLDHSGPSKLCPVTNIYQIIWQCQYSTAIIAGIFGNVFSYVATRVGNSLKTCVV
jgi:hypothetical protein